MHPRLERHRGKYRELKINIAETQLLKLPRDPMLGLMDKLLESVWTSMRIKNSRGTQ